MRSLVGGVAATAAVRTWPFRVFSLPSKLTPPSDAAAIYANIQERFRANELGFHAFEYAGIPIIEDTDCPPGYMYLLDDKYITRPETVRSWMHLGLPQLEHCQTL